MDNSSELDVDALLRNQLMGSTIETIVSSSPDGGLSAQHPFSWDRIMEDPKGNTLPAKELKWPSEIKKSRY